MSNEDWKVQASYKHGPRDQHMLNVRGNSAVDLNDTLTELTASDTAEVVVSFGQVLGALDVVMGDLGGQPASQEPPSQPNTFTTPPQQPQQPAQPQQAAGPRCAHGERQWVTGVSARGPWKAWMCPTAKGDPTKCDPEWVR